MDNKNKLCIPCDSFQLVDWKEYINVSEQFSAETKETLEKALNNLSQTPQFAKLLKDAKRRKAMLCEINQLRGFERKEEIEDTRITIFPAKSKSGSAANPLYYCISIPDKESANTRCAYYDEQRNLVKASLEQTLCHEISHLADPLYLIRTCYSEICEQLADLLPPKFLGSYFARMPTEQSDMAEQYAVTTADDIVAPAFSEPKRKTYTDFIES